MNDIHDCPDCHMRPGSDTAIEAGCTCPVLDNGHGHRSPFNVIAGDCPVHGITDLLRYAMAEVHQPQSEDADLYA